LNTDSLDSAVLGLIDIDLGLLTQRLSEALNLFAGRYLARPKHSNPSSSQECKRTRPNSQWGRRRGRGRRWKQAPLFGHWAAGYRSLHEVDDVLDCASRSINRDVERLPISQSCNDSIGRLGYVHNDVVSWDLRSHDELRLADQRKTEERSPKHDC
jgi:hypothetical protein